MELNIKTLGSQETEATTEVKKMRLDDDAAAMVFQMFSKTIYSNPIGTVVREITSNAVDSHIEAGVKLPVLIKRSIDSETGTHYISFIDYGVGMSPERVEEVYMTFFKSTKRADNTQIGGFGIGGKTPLAYKRSTGYGEGEYDNSYQIVTVFNGMKYCYLVYEGKETPLVALQHTEPTKDHNGTEIRIPVLEKDMQTFAKEMVRQLYYFENVVFEGFDNEWRYGEVLSNEYTIVRGKTFLYRGGDVSGNMHVCLGRVAYPIDYNILNLNSSDYNLPVAVKVEIGEIGVTASREQLDYSENTIKVLKKKLAEAKAEILEMMTKQYSNIVTLEDYFKVKTEFGTLEFANGMKLDVSRMIKQSDVDFSNFKYSFMKMPNDRMLFKFFFDVKAYGKKPSRSRYSDRYEFEGGYKELSTSSNILYVDGEFNRKIVKQAYLKEQYGLFHIISCRDITAGFIRSELADLFNVHADKLVDDNGKPTAYVQSLLDMQEEYFNIVRQYASDYDKLEVPEDFIASRKKKNGLSKELRNTTIPVKFLGSYGKQRVKLNDLFNYRMPIFYATQENEHKLSEAYEMFKALFDEKAIGKYDQYHGKFETGYDSYSYKKNNNNVSPKNSILFIVLSTANIKYMEYCNKAYKPEEFMWKMLHRKEAMVKRYFQTYDLKNRWDRVDSMYREGNFSKISSKWGKKIAEVNTYIEALPASRNNSNIGYMKDRLSKYFDLSDNGMSAEQKNIAKLIDEIKELEKNNTKILDYIHLPYDREIKNSTLIDILKKVMVL